MKVKKPNAVIYFLVYIFVMPFLKIFFRLEVDRSRYKPPKGPMLVICNHGSFLDFAVVMLSLYPRRLNAVTARKFFFYKPLHWFLPLMGAIPKNLFDADPRAIVGLKQVLKRGDDVLLFPEGRCECDGVYVGMHKATGKLIRQMQVPVVSCSIDGAYNCMPFWRKGLRFGRVRIVISNLLMSDDLARLSVEEINDAVDRALSRQFDPPPRRPLGTASRKRLAEGLHNLLYWCPSCDAEFTTQTSGCVISCSACGRAFDLDGYMNLWPVTSCDNHLAKPTDSNPRGDGERLGENAEVSGMQGSMPRTLHEWYKLQARREALRLHDDMKTIAANVQVRMPAAVAGEGMDTYGSGTVRFDPSGWRYDGTLHGDDVSLHFPIGTVPALPIDPDDVFQIYAHGTCYFFVPEPPRASVKYSVIGECAYWRFARDIHITPRRDSGFCAAPNQEKPALSLELVINS